MPRLSKAKVAQIKREVKKEFEAAQLKKIEAQLRQKEREKLEKGPVLKQVFDFGFSELKKGLKSTISNNKKKK